jgi:hypothetical protein
MLDTPSFRAAAAFQPPPSDEDTIRQVVEDIAAFRTRRRQLLLLPYESLDPVPWHLSPGFRDLLETRLTKGFEKNGFSIPSITGPIDWLAHNRSFAYHLNSWEPITELLMGHSMLGEVRYFEAALGVAQDWIDRFQLASFAIGPDPAALDATFGPSPWYDMAVGQRAYRLAYLTDVVARDPRYGDEDICLLVRSLSFHLRLLRRDDFYRAHNNHGFYQAFGELAASRRFRTEPFAADRYDAAAERVRLAIEQQFFPSGLHREHSPDYHSMVLGSMIGARASGLLPSSEIESRVVAAEEVLTWLLQPNGRLLTFGDTDPRSMPHEELPASGFRNTRLQYQISGGTVGEPPAGGVLALKAAGYAFARGDHPAAPGDPWWYLAQIAAFHSRVHKHADDLAFVWSDRGCEILVDPGRYGYAGKTERGSELARQGFWYSDPKRIYVESTRAHNTVEVDGRSYDRTRKPYGSALLYAGEQDGLIVTECELRPMSSVRFIRILAMAPGRFLLVLDWLLDRSGERHDFRQHFHFHPDWTVATEPADEAGTRLLAVHEGTGQRLAVVPLLPDHGAFRTVRGQEEPELLGWYSHKPYSLTPSTTIVSEQLGTDYALFATLLTFAPDPCPAPKPTVVRRSLRPGIIGWEEGGESVRLEVRRGDDDQPVTVSMSRRELSSTNAADRDQSDEECRVSGADE